MSERKKTDRVHTPFLIPSKTPTIDGIYRSKETGKLLWIKNSWLKGFIDGETSEPYDAYQGWMHIEGGNPIKKCLIEVQDLFKFWDKVF